MSGRDLHKKAFDEETIAKLEIFEDYAQAWVPTFVMSGVPRIAVFDFFAGQGYDLNAVPGSAMRILQKIKGQIANIKSRGVKCELYFNEFKKKKSTLLQSTCGEFLDSNPDLKGAIEIHYSNEDFGAIFSKLLPRIGSIPSLVYLDQNGIKAISQKYFQQLESKKQTDFLYFVSSSYYWRFGESDEFKSHLDIDLTEAKKGSYRFIHRHVLNQIRKGLPEGSKLKLYPFSIKKGSNIHGLVFGATHPLAVDKFLRIAWKRNDTNGEANFDIDEDHSKAQPDLWGRKSLTKLERFERDLREKVLNREITDNAEALNFCYSEGHLGSHADVILRSMKKRGEISYDSASPLVTYENVYRLKKIIQYKTQ